jgi:signal transduction histidine kinase/DNA-binding response OmpR family regulator
MSITQGKNKKALVAFMLVLFLFLVIINVLVVTQQRQLLVSETNAHENSEAEIFTFLVSSLLVQHDYAKIVDFVQQWGNSRPDITHIQLRAPNGFIIAEYKAGQLAANPSSLLKDIKSMDDKDYQLSLTHDRTAIIEHLNAITSKLIIVSAFIFVLLGTILWLVLKRIALVPLHREISRHERTTNELLDAKEQAEKASRTKSAFLANMSHEIRTPMNGIIGMLSLLKETPLTKEQFDFLDTANSSAETLLSIINDILDFSKIEAGRLELDESDFNLIESVENVMTLLAEYAHSKGIELAFEIDPKAPLMVRGDPVRLRQVLINLVNNAIKFTEQGEVVLKLDVLDKQPSTAKLRFTISDTGIGIAKSKIDSIFDSFSQADSSTTRNFGGTGLGLAISKQLVMLMGGNIGVESEPGVGSSFRFDIEPEVISYDSPIPYDYDLIKNNRVIIVDDNQTNRTILQHQLQNWGLESELAEDAYQALEMIKQSISAGKPYDIALVDMMMPGMDGAQLCEQLRANPETARLAIIMLTSLAGHTAEEYNSIKQYVDHYLTKPVRQSLLFDAIVSSIQARGPSHAANMVPDDALAQVQNFIPAQSIPPILVAEDNPVNQKVIAAYLKKLGYQVRLTSNGKEAIEQLLREKFSLVLMDCQMPVLDGYAATQQIRGLDNDTRNITIIAMTANAMEGDREKCLEAGMNDYLAKPIKLDVLNNYLEKWLAR